MRAKVILFAAALALLILLPALYFHFAPASTPPPQPAGAAADASSSPPTALAGAPHRLSAVGRRDNAVPALESDSGADSTAANRENFVTERVVKLGDLGTSNDPVSLKGILSQLNNQNPAIRKAALDATLQFGSQDALPTLRNQLSWAEDLQEKMDIQNAIDFLQLHSFESVKQEVTTQ